MEPGKMVYFFLCGVEGCGGVHLCESGLKYTILGLGQRTVGVTTSDGNVAEAFVVCWMKTLPSARRHTFWYRCSGMV